MISALIIDDHAVVRRGLRQILEETSDIRVQAEASSAAEAIELIWTESFDVVLLDITMPGRNGFDILQQVRAKYPKLPILILSMHSEEQYGVRMLKAGASGYLSKESAPEQLVNAIRKVAGGGKYVSPELAEKVLVDYELHEGKAPHELLSNREFQVLCMIGAGKTVKQIAEEIDLSEKTISTYRTRLLEKMNLATNAELTYYAITNNLLPK